MANNSKKYVSLSKLGTFLDNLATKFAALIHTHKLSDITDYAVDTELSSTSTNPVQNKVVDAEFEAISTAMNALDLAIDGKADAAHDHSIGDITNLQSSLDEKVPTSRTVNGKSLVSNITLNASDVGASDSDHTHDDRYYTESEIDSKLSGKADSDHNHDDDYYTQLEVDNKLATKSDTTHNHDSSYDAQGTASTTVATHNTATDAHNDIRLLISDLNTKVTNFLDVDDTTKDQLSEVIQLIDDNKGDLESLTTSKVNVADIVDNLTTASTSKVLSANQGVAIKSLIDGKAASSHTHTVANITDLTATATELNYLEGATSNIQTQLNNKAATSALSNYYTKTEIDDYEFITVSDIDTICSSTIQVATLDNEVVF